MRSKLAASAVALGVLTASAFGLGQPRRAEATVSPAARSELREAERHPEIRAAIVALERAKGHLQHAAHDFGGHRVEAIAAIDRALEQLRLALDFDKK